MNDLTCHLCGGPAVHRVQVGGRGRYACAADLEQVTADTIFWSTGSRVCVQPAGDWAAKYPPRAPEPDNSDLRACFDNNGHIQNDRHARADCPAEPPKPLDATKCLQAGHHTGGHSPIDCPVRPWEAPKYGGPR